MKEKLSALRTCDICGAVIDCTGKRYYCAACSKIAIQRKAHEKYITQKDADQAYINTFQQKPKYIGPTISEINSAAKSENLSYGKYVCKYNI